jgi:hypothetical protein
MFFSRLGSLVRGLSLLLRLMLFVLRSLALLTLPGLLLLPAWFFLALGALLALLELVRRALLLVLLVRWDGWWSLGGLSAAGATCLVPARP